MHTNHRRSPNKRHKSKNHNKRSWEKRISHHIYRQMIRERMLWWPEAYPLPIMDEAWNPWYYD